jgi:hypothetical protein
VLTTDALLLATSVKAKTVLTVVPRADIRAVMPVEPYVTDIAYDDYTHAVRRVVRLELNQDHDKEAIVGQLRAGVPGSPADG